MTTTTAAENLPAALPTPRVLYVLRGALVFVANAYVFSLLVYLALRLLVNEPPWWLALLHDFAPLVFLPLVALIPAAVLLRLRGALARLLLLAAIGALWFGPYFLPKAHTTSTGPALKLVTFNTFPYNTRFDNIAGWLREVNADVVLLQEIPIRYTQNGFPALKDIYPHQFNLPYETGRSDQFILSRWPLLNEDGIDLEGDGWPTHQRVTVEIDGQTIAIYNVHLLMPVRESPRLRLPAFLGKLEFALKYDASARNAEIQRLLILLEDDPLPFVVAGDFNMSDQALIYGDLAARLGDSFREAGNGFGMSWPAGASEELPDILPSVLRLDYIWHSDHFRAVDAAQGPKLGSDHLPVYATLEIVPLSE